MINRRILFFLKKNKNHPQYNHIKRLKNLKASKIKMTELKIPVSVGELIDKLSILQIKIEKIIDDNKLSHVQTEYKKLKEASEIYLNQKSINSLFNKLLDVNRILWNIEDLIREKDKKLFGKQSKKDFSRNYICQDFQIFVRRFPKVRKNNH